MAVCLLSSHEISDLCIGKPPLRCLPAIATVSDALSELKRSGDPWISIWSCCEQSPSSESGCVNEISAESKQCCCIGKVSVVDVVCFLSAEENLSQPFTALEAPVSVLVNKIPQLVEHLEPNASLLEAIECIQDGVQNLIIPVRRRKTHTRHCPCQHHHSFGSSTEHNGFTYCTITPEDVVRFLLNSINHFCPTPTKSIESLNLINHDILVLNYDDPALPSLKPMHEALASQMGIAVVDQEGRLVGEISPYNLASCGEHASAAIATLSVGDLMAYINSGSPPDDLLQLVKLRLEDKNLESMVELLYDETTSASSPFSSTSPSHSSSSASSASSDEEFGFAGGIGKVRRSSSSGRLPRTTEAVVCKPGSSLVAVMIQALAHRVNYAWVVEADYRIVGMVTFAGMLKAFRDHIHGFL